MLTINTSLTDSRVLSPRLKSILEESGAFGNSIRRSSCSAFVPFGTTPSHKKKTKSTTKLQTQDPLMRIKNGNQETLQKIFSKLTKFLLEYNRNVTNSHENSKISNYEIFKCYMIAIDFILSLQQKHIDIKSLNIDIVARTIIIISRKIILQNCSEPILIHYIQMFSSSIQTKIFCMERYIKYIIDSKNEHSKNENLLYDTVNNIILRVVKKRERGEYNNICIMVQWILCNKQCISIEKTVKIACYIILQHSQHLKTQDNLKDTLELTSTDLELTMILIWYYNSIIYYNLYI